MAKKSITDTYELLNVRQMPQLGFGVFKSPTNLAVKTCLRALEAGYRHIDTAQLYGNESEVGEALRQTEVPRQDIFITTKILKPGGSVDKSYDKCADSIEKLHSGEGGYVDLFLVHSPRYSADERKEMWLAIERLHAEGKAKSIGVSNFGIKHIEELKPYATVWPPHVNQLELHPWNQQEEIVNYCREKGIVVQAYCPMARNKRADDKTVAQVAQKHGVTPYQILIRYSLEKGWSPLPKSDNPDRIKSNADIYAFALDSADMAVLDGLDEGGSGAIVRAVENH